MPYDELVKAITSGLTQFRVADAVDIIIIAILLYRLIVLTKETRAYQVLKGIGVLFIAAILSDTLQLQAVSWLLNSIMTSGLICAVVLFQPELRRALEHIGRGKLFDKSMFADIRMNETHNVTELMQAMLDLSKRRVGALIVIEQKTGLGDIIATGTLIEGVISAPLIENVFEPNTPLHDGAMVIRDNKIIAAACFLPLSEDFSVSRELGTRHRAALGVSSVSDSITLIVSEETGVISFARDGKLVRYLDQKALKALLESIFVKHTDSPLTMLRRRNKNEK